MAEKNKYFKVIVVGERGIGMTSFVRRYAEGLFPEYISKVYGLDYRLKVTKEKGVTFKIQVWDKMCSQEFRYVYEGYTSTADVVCLLYDITSMKSFLELEFWLKQVSNVQRKLIIGLKCDLEERREVSRSKGESFAKNRGLDFIEVSAKEGTNMDKVLNPHNICISNLHTARKDCILAEKEKEANINHCRIM
ncbi:Ras-related protein Rab-30 [Oopsacas minuta]|uniref:Ras-related protein Rab-30 n=1 Tax=Oopsacas minuta TaxID=111878 RepID=A0AAV7JBK9_9METZ|nr:Ras-related protein Rab-30 [Oopsacas minuta]